MENIYLYLLAGIFAPIVLALVVKAIKRIPADLKGYLVNFSHYLKG